MTAEEKFVFNTHQDLIEGLSIAGRPLTDLIGEIQSIYSADSRPWVIGFSGGKDSTTVLSLIFHAVSALPVPERTKKIYVVSSNTLVETPVVEEMINTVLQLINSKAEEYRLPISAHAVSPITDRTFWVNLLGRGYPAPTTRFRWCTERMKIEPVSAFILDRAAEFGEVVVALGSRSAESSTRAQVIAKHRIEGTSLGRHSSLPNAYTYMPIEDWQNDDVWQYLMSAPCPWGGSNRELLDLYKGSNQGECPVVIDKSTPSCGNSRFGCWTCTVVTEDRALHGLIESGATWMQPLLRIRDYLWHTTQSDNINKYRNPKRRTGKITFSSTGSITEDGEFVRKHIHGPYWMKYRKLWLRRLLSEEKRLRENGQDIELVSREELHAIRQQWLWDPNEPDWSDSLPKIFKSLYPDEYVDWIDNDAGIFSGSDQYILNKYEEETNVPAAMIMKMMEVELDMSGLSRRDGLLNRLESILNQDWSSFEDVAKARANEPLKSAHRRKVDELMKRHEDLKP
ncbi:DNA phosphorothioation system sulfurtransferase DndC [Seongchinamella sediminis]|uniref:DNA phosphorothioation system sulfurtransferase DndC n=1 Tax=Seongchinamella sediminis TaxID=2283635 RepID=A0A3L7DU05_9GAMM|nr:DNA phosphorothioation system sulfurtransferase DndC [Seongchinamella sediminis]RLQ20255.1 DNA phosphorothioation system sulfurtransferase DndC [Seongchinamella sediminis]